MDAKFFCMNYLFSVPNALGRAKTQLIDSMWSPFVVILIGVTITDMQTRMPYFVVNPGTIMAAFRVIGRDEAGIRLELELRR